MITHKYNIEKNNPRRPVVFYVFLVIFCFLLAGAGFICLRLRNGVQVKAPQDRDILPDTEVVLYRQDDARWGEDRLGDSKYTMRSSGCLVSCIASAVSMERGIGETPGTLNTKFSAEQAYDAEGNLLWEPLSELGEYEVDVWQEVSADIIDTCLSQGHYPIVRVRMYMLGNVHYVLIVGVKDGKYLCMDPLQDDLTTLSLYGNRVYGIRCVSSGNVNLEEERESNTMEDAENTGLSTEENLPDTDLNRNGIPEELRIVEPEYGEGEQLEVWENGERLLMEAGYYDHEDRKAVFLYRRNGEDYLLRYQPAMYQGCGDYSYALFSMEDGGETTVQWGAVSFDINFGSPVHKDFEAESIASFMEDINDLLSYSIPLINTDSDLLKTFEKEGKLVDTLWWLDSDETEFMRDASKSLSENLRDFQESMTGEKEPVLSKSVETLPFDQAMEMEFCSGAGAWRTSLILNPDGSFTGHYTDADMGLAGTDYPNGTLYVCKFHGRFGEMKQISDASFSLSLSELVIDTEHPVGEEWIEDGVRCISSEPYGFDGHDGTALKPGASFLFYMPEATGHEPGTELYGALQFCSWRPERRELLSENDRLGYYGLHNLETGYGFFSEETGDNS